MHEVSWFKLDEITREEAQEAIKLVSTAILPIGATEQHGPHLPQGTDTYLAEEMARRLAGRIGAIVLPAIPFGYSWVWRDIPGSVVLSMETVKNIVSDIVQSVARWGMKRLVVISAHGANDSAIKYAIREQSDRVSTDLYYFTYPGVNQTAERHAESPMWHGMVHACELETSWMLAVKPELCRMEKAVKEYPDGPASYLYHHSSLPMGALSKSGVFGDATVANREKGEVMLEEIVDYMENVLAETSGLTGKIHDKTEEGTE